MMQDQVMTHGANGKTLTRLAAVLFMGLAFAGCAMMLGAGGDSLFVDIAYPVVEQASAY
jgi:hypothetical protein